MPARESRGKLGFMKRIAPRLFAPSGFGIPRLLCAGLLLLGTAGSSLYSGGPDKPLRLAALISSVQLYSDQALVSRTARVRLSAGVNRIYIENLPAGLRDDSVQADLARPNGVKISEIRVESIHEKIYKTQEAREAEKNLHAAQFRLNALTDRYVALREEKRYLNRIQIGREPKGKDAKAPEIEPERWRETLDYARGALKENHRRLREILDRIDLAREELSVALMAADRFRKGVAVSKKTVFITLESQTARRIELRLSYHIGGAGWYPAYAARVRSSRGAGDQARVRLLGYALVRNRTGEDWKNVRLTFSAADPTQSAALPRLYAWKIKGRTVRVFKKRRKYGRKRDSARGYASRTRPGYSRGGKSSVKREKLKRDDFFKPSPKKRPAQGPVPIQQRNMLRRYAQANQAYLSNKGKVREKRAGRRSLALERNLNSLRSHYNRQERDWNRGRYRSALRSSRRVLDSINRLEPRYQSHFKQEFERASRVNRLSLRLLEQERLLRALISPRRSSRGYDYRYSALIPETIPSDGAFHKTLILDVNLKAALRFETAPLVKKLAFLVGKVPYRGSAPMLAGPISVFHNTDFVGQAALANVSPRENFILNLGNDESMELDRKVSEYRTKSGLFTTTYKITRTVKITVKNRKSSSLTLFVFDRVPVPVNDKVVVDEIRLSPEAEKRHKKAGLLRFRLRLSPGEKKVITIQYRIKYDEGVYPVFREKYGPRW